ncbi:MAG: TonB-dependent receptor [Siphonobacter sp.]
MKNWVVLIGIMMWYSKAHAQIACRDSIRGVVERTDGLPLIGARIWLEGISRGTITDSLGHFTVPLLCPGNYLLRCQFLGYIPQERQISIPQSGILQFRLVSKATDLQELRITQHRSEGQQLLQVQSELAGQALDQVRGQSLGEMLKAITGLYSIQTGPTISKPVIHGLHSNRILILNNGIRQEGQQWGSEHAPEIDAFLASRLTVIKGAASIRYGSDAIGGVILVEPKDMPADPGLSGEVNIAGGSNGRMGIVSGRMEGAFSGALSGLSARVQGTLKQSGYVKTPHYYLENTSYRERNFSTDIHYDRKKLGIELFYSRFATKIGLFTGAQIGSLADLYAALQRSEPLVQPGFSYQLERPYQDVQHDLIKLKAFLRSDRWGTFTITAARQQNLRQEYDYVPFSGALTPELYLKLVTHTADLIWEKAKTKPSGQWSSSAGFTGLTQGNVREYLFLIPNYRTYAGGAFVLEQFRRKQLQLEAGIRYDYRWLRAYFLDELTNTVYFKTHTWSNSNASLGASYQLHNHLSILANVSTAWRAPNVADLYSDGLHQSAVAYEHGNENLVPEKAYNANLSFIYTKKRLTAELGLYNNLISNYIYLKPDSLPVVKQRGTFPSYTYDQVRATFRGVDLTLSYDLSSKLSLNSKTSLLFAYDHTHHDYLVSITPQRTENSISYLAGNWKKFRQPYVRLTTLFVAHQNRAPAVSSRLENGQYIYTGDFAPPPPAYFLLGAELGTTLAIAKQSVGIIVTGTNLMNTVYRDYLNRFRYFADEPGRNVMLKLKVPF